MSLEKAIEHGKEKRRKYRRSKAFDKTCRNHGSCPYCEGGRLYQRKKAEKAAEEQIKDFEKAGFPEEEFMEDEDEIYNGN